MWINFFSATLVFLGITILSWQVIFPWTKYVLGAQVSQKILNPIPTNWDIFSQTVPTSMVETLNQSILTSLERVKVPPEFFLTVKKLDIKNARVITNLDVRQKNSYLPELSNGIGHLLGSSYPGEWGNVILFGHSVSPLFYNPQDYSRIFSTLPTLEIGDRFTVDFDNRQYVYQVDEKRVVDPDANPSEFQVDPGRRITLITCVPPGLVTKRLLVIGRLVD